MNWFTNKVFRNLSSVTDLEDQCDHLEDNPNQPVYVTYEYDSFGIVSSYAACESCDEKDKEELEETTEVCRDCKQPTKVKDGSHWQWYDFYAPQGDEAIFICNECWNKPSHQRRMAKDKRDEEMDLARQYFDDDDYDDEHDD